MVQGKIAEFEAGGAHAKRFSGNWKLDGRRNSLTRERSGFETDRKTNRPRTYHHFFAWPNGWCPDRYKRSVKIFPSCQEIGWSIKNGREIGLVRNIWRCSRHATVGGIYEINGSASARASPIAQVWYSGHTKQASQHRQIRRQV